MQMDVLTLVTRNGVFGMAWFCKQHVGKRRAVRLTRVNVRHGEANHHHDSEQREQE